MNECDTSYPKFSSMNNLLGGFNSDVCGPNTKDADVVAQFVNEEDKSVVQRAISQGYQLLKLPLDEFPVKWIRSLTCRLPGIKGAANEHTLEPSRENYYNWVKWIVEELEKEAKKQGKL